MCAAPVDCDLRQSGLCRRLLEGAALQEIYSILAAIRVWMGTDTFYLPTLSQGLLTMGSMARFPVHKGYFGKPAHHTGVSLLRRLEY